MRFPGYSITSSIIKKTTNLSRCSMCGNCCSVDDSIKAICHFQYLDNQWQLKNDLNITSKFYKPIKILSYKWHELTEAKVVKTKGNNFPTTMTQSRFNAIVKINRICPSLFWPMISGHLDSYRRVDSKSHCELIRWPNEHKTRICTRKKFSAEILPKKSIMPLLIGVYIRNDWKMLIN